MIGSNYQSFSFTRAAVAEHAPQVSGVYAIFNQKTWIYIGESGDLRRRLLEHLNGDNPKIAAHAPTGFQTELSAAQDRVAHQDQLIAQLKPVVNER